MNLLDPNQANRLKRWNPVWRRVVERFLGPQKTCRFELVTGGFSGAQIVRVEVPGLRYALRRWPQRTLPLARIHELHRFLLHLKDCGLPVAVPCRDRHFSESVVEDEGTFWQLEPWLSGEVRDAKRLDRAECRSMMRCVALLHQAAEQYTATERGEEWFASARSRIPAIQERIALIDGWKRSRIRDCRESLLVAPPDFANAAKTILAGFERNAAAVRKSLEAVDAMVLPIFPCWRDLWKDHVLFEDGRVSGLIDATATRRDHYGTDLSRLLGSFFEDDQEAWESALQDYESIRALSPLDRQIVKVLDRSSVLLSGMTWVDRWAQRALPAEQIPDVVERLISFERRLRRLRRL